MTLRCCTLRTAPGMAGACAGDLAVALRSSRLARDITPVFREAEIVAGLRLKPSPWKALAHEGAPEWGEFAVAAIGT